MKLAVLLLGLWAITATNGGPVLKAVTAPTTKPADPTKAPEVPPADLIASKFKVSFKLANVKYTDELLSYDSGVYQNYAGKILKALMNLYAEDDSYREASMVGFRNDSGVVADVVLRFGNESKNLVSLDALIKTGILGELPVDPTSLKASKDESVPPIAGGFGCGSPCGAPTTCFPQCSQDCCGGSSAPNQYMPQMNQQFGAPVPLAGQSQCPGSCPGSCAPSCEQSCCGGAGAAGAAGAAVGGAPPPVNPILG